MDLRTAFCEAMATVCTPASVVTANRGRPPARHDSQRFPLVVPEPVDGADAPTVAPDWKPR